MADHFYQVAVGELSTRDVSKITVGASTGGGNIELRITDGTITRRQAYLFLEFLADVFASGSNQSDGFPVPVGGFTG